MAHESSQTIVIAESTLLHKAVSSSKPEQSNFAHLLDLGIEEDNVTLSRSWRIITDIPANEAHYLLHNFWRAYFNTYCLRRCIDADVFYIGAGGNAIRRQGYGFEDGQVSGSAYVYGQEYWLALGNPDPSRCDWTDLLRHITYRDLAGPVSSLQFEAVLAQEMQGRVSAGEQLVVARLIEGEPGFNAIYPSKTT